MASQRFIMSHSSSSSSSRFWACWPLAWFIGHRFSALKSHNQLVNFISGISTLGLAMAVALLMLVVAIMNGFDRELRERILQVMPQISLYHQQGIEDWQTLADDIQQLPSAKPLKAIAPFVQLEGMLTHQQVVEPVSVFGIDPEREVHVSGMNRYITQGALERLKNSIKAEPDGGLPGVIIGKGVQQKLNVHIGDHLTLIVPKPQAVGRGSSFAQITVIGVLDTGTKLDHSLALMGLNHAANLTENPNKISGFRAKIDDLFEAPRIAFNLVSELPYGYYTDNWTRQFGNLYEAIHMSTRLVNILLVLIIGIAVFNVVSTMVMAVVDKHADIAILRTMGASPAEIGAIFLVQGGLIGCIGTAVGIALGHILALLAPKGLVLLESVVDMKLLRSDVYPVNYLPIDIRWENTALLAVTAIVLSVLAAMYPAWRASKIPPAEALRFD